MKEIRTAADLEVEDLDEDELRRQNAAKAAASRQARSAALRSTGAVPANVGTSGLSERLDARLKAIDRRVVNDGRAKDIVRSRLHRD